MLDSVSMGPVGLEDLREPVVAERLTREGIADVGGDVVVAEADGVGMAVRPLADLCGRPGSDTGHGAEPPIGLTRRHPHGALE